MKYRRRTDMKSTKKTPAHYANRVVEVGWEGLSLQEAKWVNANAVAVASQLPRPLAYSLLDLLDVPVPPGFKALPPRRQNIERARAILGILVAKGNAHTLRTCDRLGGTFNAADVCARTGWTKRTLNKAKRENRVMSFRLPDSSADLFPKLQFDGGEVRPWIPELLKYTGNGFAALSFLTARRVSLRGKAYAEKLRDDLFGEKIVTQMLVRAHKFGDPAASPTPPVQLPQSEPLRAKTRNL
jgi:hypothetical protein